VSPAAETSGGEVLSPSAPPPPDAASTMALLAGGDMRLLGLMPNASNYTFLAEVAGDGHAMFVVYKPVAGEIPLWDFPDGTLAGREVAAFLLASSLGWPNVPPTILRDGPHGVGSAQVFVDADFAQHYFTLRETRLEEFRTVAAFDVIANNADRKGGACLVGADDRSIWSIDHGVCFNVVPKLRTVIWEFAGDRVPATLLADARRVVGELRSGPLREALLPLLTADEVDVTAKRAERLASQGCYPKPGSERSYPWPPV